MSADREPQAWLLTGALRALADAVATVEQHRDDFTGLDPAEQVEAVALAQNLRKRLSATEETWAARAGQTLGAVQGNLADGRQFTLKRGQERREWDHDDWKRDVRRAITAKYAPHPDDVAVDAATGEARPLARIVQEALHDAQAVHGATAPKSTALKALGLFATDYCSTSPAGWRFTALDPKPSTTTTEA